MSAIEDSVRPIWDAGLVELISDGDELLPGLIARAAPGHTAGQLAIELLTNDAVGLFTADIFHQPMQIVRPAWNSRFCEVPAQAIATRRRILERAPVDRAVLFPSHPGAPHAGRIGGTSTGRAFAAEFSDYIFTFVGIPNQPGSEASVVPALTTCYVVCRPTRQEADD